MKTITIIAGVTATLTDRAARAYERELREEQAHRELLQWLAAHDKSDELYSDIYKDVYGVRPRW